MRHLLLLLPCLALSALPVRAEDDEPEEEHAAIEAPEPEPAPAKRAPAPYRAPRRSAPAVHAPASAPAAGADASGTSQGGAGISRGEGSPRSNRVIQRDTRAGSGAAAAETGESGPAGNGDAAPAGDGGFEVIDIGRLPTIGQIRNTGSGADRPVISLGGGKKWAIRMRHKGPEKGAFPMLIGGTNGDLTGGGKYAYKAAISKSPGVVSGSGALCVGEMVNSAYTTCQQPCSMKWELRFGTPKNQRLWKELCELENDQIYYLNIAPAGGGCKGGQAESFGCPIVMEVANGGRRELNPGGLP